MSVTESCASTELSMNSTIEWMIDCGCTMTSTRGISTSNKPARLDHLQPFVEEGRGVDRDLAAHFPRGMFERLLECDVRKLVGRHPAKRAHRSPSG
jgi:hypothetical protein